MIPYSVHVALVLTTCLLFYKLLLQKETYHWLNRVVLLICIVLAFALPLVHVPQQFSFRTSVPPVSYTADAPVINKNYTAGNPVKVETPINSIVTVSQPPVSVIIPEVPLIDRIIKWMFWLYWCGVAALAINFLLQIIALLYQVYKNPAMQDGIYRIVELNDDKAPCSFGNNIFINPAKYDWDTYNQILIHEKIHIQQRHSVDLIIAELMLILQWFNPFAWLYRKEVENNLEFLTDYSVLNVHKIEPEDYQLSLLKVSVPNFSMRITTNYNQSLLRRRIIMMNAKRSNIHSTWKYFMLMPLLVILVCGLNKPIAVSSSLSLQQQVADSLQRPKKATAKVPATSRPKKITANKTTAVKRTPIDSAAVKTAKAGFSSKPFNKQTFSAKPFPASDSPNVKTTWNADTKQRVINNPADGPLKDINSNYILPSKSMNLNYLVGHNGNPNLKVTDIYYLQSHGISIDYVTGLAHAGYGNLTVEDIYYLKSHEVSVEYVRDLASSGYRTLSAPDIYYLQSHGIDIEYAKGLTQAGYRNLKVEDIYYLKSHGISIDYAKGLASAGYRNLSAPDIYYLQSHGINIEYAKGLAEAGYRNLKVEDIYYLKSHGISIEYIKGVTKSGYDLQSKGIKPDK